MYRVSRLLIFLLLISLSAAPSTVVRLISNTDGLSNNSVNCIFEDSRNTLWIGTWDGLNAFDGRDIRSFRYNKTDETSVSNNVIRQILQQGDPIIWVATDHGINRLDTRNYLFTNYFPGTEDRAPKQERSYLMALTSFSDLLVFVKDEGLFCYDTKRDVFRGIELPFPVEDIIDMSYCGGHVLFFLLADGRVIRTECSGTGDGLAIRSYTFPKITMSVTHLFSTPQWVWMSGGSALQAISPGGEVVYDLPVPAGRTVSGITQKEHLVTAAFAEGGCIRYSLDTGQWEWIPDIPDHLPLFTLYEGSQDILWVGSDGQGLLQVYDYQAPFRTVYSTHPVRAFAEDVEGHLWVATKGDGIKIMDAGRSQMVKHLQTADGLPANSVYSLQLNRNGDLFIGTEGEGIVIAYGGQMPLKMLKLPPYAPVFKAVYAIHFSHNDSLLWLGTSGYGLIKLQVKKEKGVYEVLRAEQFISTGTTVATSNDVIYTITDGPEDGSVWFGTRGGGLNRIDPETNRIEPLETAYPGIILSNNDILSLATPVAHGVWVGTSYGLNYFSYATGQPSVKQYTEGNGLANNTVHGILMDDERDVWVSTNQGLSHIRIPEGDIRNYAVNDGLQNDEFADGAYYKDRDGRFYFGGVSGFSYFLPGAIHQRSFIPGIQLNSLKIYNSEVVPSEMIRDRTLHLSYEERFVTFSFIAKDFIRNENCEYAYRLINYSDEWVYMGTNPQIVFAKLPSGSYTLEVKGTNGDKVWNNTPYVLHIRVGYPWWLSLPAILIYLVLLGVTVSIVRSVILNRIRMSRQLLVEKMEKQHQQREHESKLNFFTNVAHEFFTPLTLIYGPAQQLLERSELDSYTKRYVQVIRNNAERMQKLISELMEFRKAKTGHTPLHPEELDIKLLTEYVTDNYQDALRENKVDFVIRTEGLSKLYTDRNSLEKIFFNLWSNAYKYTPANGYIHVWVKQDGGPDNTLHLTVRNSGKGMAEHQMREVFDKFRIFDNPGAPNSVSTGIGLNLTYSLTELLGGTIEVDSILGEYTEFSVRIPSLPRDSVNIVEMEMTTVPGPEPGDLTDEQPAGIRVLIVEDEKQIRELLKDILSPYYFTDEACDGEEALQSIARNHPDLIITDILMPHMDGIALIDQLKSDPKTAYIPIIGVSARSAVEDHIDAYKHGADVYITKPFHPHHVLSAIKNLISKQSFLKRYYDTQVSSIRVKDGMEIHKDDAQLIERVTKYILNNMDDETLNPQVMAEFLHMSKASLYRKLKDITGKTPAEFLRTVRLEHAAKQLRKSKATVSEIMYQSGFSNKSYFYREFARQYGVSPKEYRGQV